MASGAPRFHSLVVDDVRREGRDAVSIRFRVPAGLAADYRFAAGQYLTVRGLFEGEELRRSYSICSGPDDGELRIGVKRVEGGVVSTWLNDGVAVGDSIEVMTPTGRFGILHTPGEARVHVGFAAGSGITPILSIARGVLSREPCSRFFLFYGNRATADVLFHEELADLKDRALNRLSVFHVFSREQQDVPVLNGRLDREKIRLLLTHVVQASEVSHAFLCGPSAMSDEIEAALLELGLAPAQVHVERFVSGLGGRPRAPVARLAVSAPPVAMASIVADGKRYEVPVAGDEAILDAALRAGLDLPYACKGGMCSTCRARLVEGSAEMAVNFSLEAWETAAGFVLTCQARPTSLRVVIDYDQV